MQASSKTLLPFENRIKTLDAAKGLMLINVIIGHTAGADFAAPLDTVMLPMFWFCAGYTSKPTFSLVQRAKKLLVPYLLMSLICILYVVMINPRAITTDTLVGLVMARPFLYSNLSGAAHNIYIMNACNAVLWFLPSLFTGYCIFKLLLKSPNVISRIFLSLLSLTIAYRLSKLPILLPWSIDLAFFIAPTMLAGHIAREKQLLNKAPIEAFDLSFALFLASHLACGHTNFAISDYGNSLILAFTCGTFGSAAFILLCKQFSNAITMRFFAYINTYALYIFGLQLLPIDFIAGKLAAYNISNDIIWPIQTIFALIFGILAYKIFAKIGHLSSKVYAKI